MKSVLTAFLALMLGVQVASASPLALKSVPIKKKTGAYTMTGSYPKTGIAAVDKDIAALVNKEMQTFMSENKQAKNPGGHTYGWYWKTTTRLNNGKVLALQFEVRQYTGGAHDNVYYHTRNYLVPSGKAIQFGALFKDAKNAMGFMSFEGLSQIKKALGEYADPDQIIEGLGPKLENYKNFNLTTKGLHFQLDPYQVAPYAAGPQEFTMPYSELKDYLSSDFSNAKLTALTQ